MQAHSPVAENIAPTRFSGTSGHASLLRFFFNADKS